jgi:iron-sulfur cluster assembly protein
MSDEAIVQFTENAIAHIHKVIDLRGSGSGFRLSVKKTGCNGYMYQPEVVDQHQEGDHHLLLADDLSVYIDAGALEFLKGTIVDYVESGMGQKKLMFNNPNAVGECGCGESFNIKESEAE